MDPEELEQANQANDSQADDDQQEASQGDDAVSLADAMWGDKAGEDTVVTAEGETGDQPVSEEGDGEADGEAQDAADADKSAEGETDKDEVSDDELVKGLSEKAQKRFRELVNTNKDMEARLTGFQEIISDARVTPQDMVDLLAYGKAIRTGDFDQARAILAEQARQLELASGKAVELGDPLGDYPDLKQSVDDMELTRAHALELARVRRQNESIQRQSEQQARIQEQDGAQQQAVAQGFGEVQALAAGWAKSDLDWKTKEPLLIKRAGVIQQNYPPQQWGAMMRLAYDEITDTLKAARPTNRQPQPLRPNAIGGGSKAPASLHEAMWGESETA